MIDLDNAAQSVSYEVWLNTPKGERLQQLANYGALQWVRHVNSIGGFALDFATADFDRRLYRKDGILEIWRVPEGAAAQPIMMGFMRRLRRWRTSNASFIRIAGLDQVDLLNRRIIAAAAGSANASRTGTADNVMKAYVRAELGSGAAAGRNMTALGFAVQPDNSLGPSVSKGASRRNLLIVLQELSDLAARKGTRVFFDVIGHDPSSFEFRTYKNQRGVDRTVGTNPVVFSAENDSLINPVLEEDATDEVTFAYAGGTGIEADRAIQTDEDTVRSGIGPFGRREAFVNLASQAPTPALLLEGAKQRVREGRPRRVFTATIQNTRDLQYGINWNFGDKILAAFDEEAFDCDVRTISASFTNGKEILNGALSYVD